MTAQADHADPGEDDDRKIGSAVHTKHRDNILAKQVQKKNICTKSRKESEFYHTYPTLPLPQTDASAPLAPARFPPRSVFPRAASRREGRKGEGEEGS